MIEVATVSLVFIWLLRIGVIVAIGWIGWSLFSGLRLGWRSR